MPQSLNAQFNLGLIAERQGRLADAQAAYEQVLAKDPNHPPTLLNLGRLYRLQDKFDDAIRLYEKALKAPGHEHDVALLNNLTVAYRLAGKFDLAEATARRVLARSKDNPEAYKNLALIYYDQGQYRLAEVVSANARKLAENDPGVYNNLGMIYLKLNDRPRALAQFQKAVSLDEKFAPGHLNIGAMALAYRDYAGPSAPSPRRWSWIPPPTRATSTTPTRSTGRRGAIRRRASPRARPSRRCSPCARSSRMPSAARAGPTRRTGPAGTRRSASSSAARDCRAPRRRTRS